MTYHVGVYGKDTVIDVVEIKEVRTVQVNDSVYYLKDLEGKCVFSIPLERTAYIKLV